MSVSPESYSGYTNLDVDGENHAAIALHQREGLGYPFVSWGLQLPIECHSLYSGDQLWGFDQTSCPEVLWPITATARDVTPPVIHEIAIEKVDSCDRGLIYYWRFADGIWSGPTVIDSSEFAAYALVDDPNSGKVAFVFIPSFEPGYNGLLNVAYYESTTMGVGWRNGTEIGPSHRRSITNYLDPLGPQAWPDITAAYDNDGVLNVAWVEQRFANLSPEAAIRHWNSSRNTIRHVAMGYWEAPGQPGMFNLNLAKLTMGIGDGSTLCQGGGQTNANFLYITFTQFAGRSQAELADYSLSGYSNGELYLAVSNSGGNTWSPSHNLTNTKTPECDPGPADTLNGDPQHPENVCRSEHWASIGQTVSDIDIVFVSDRDAGASPRGEGTWQLNPIHYLHLPGGTTDAQYICPVIAPVFEATLTGSTDGSFFATPSGSADATLTVLNIGNATLSGSISVTDFPGVPTLTVGGAGAYSTPAGAPDLVRSVSMAPNGAAEGLYSGSISITHNDGGQPSPQVLPIDLFVIQEVECIPVPEDCSNPCICPCAYDPAPTPTCDGITDVTDVVATINIAFRGVAGITDPGCPTQRSDVNNDAVTNVLDVVRVVNVAFRGMSIASQFVHPCTQGTTAQHSDLLEVCGTREVEELIEFPDDIKWLQRDCARGRCDDKEVRDLTPIPWPTRSIRVYVHVMRKTNGQVAANEDSIKATIAQLNKGFAPDGPVLTFCLQQIKFHTNDALYELSDVDSVFDLQLAEMKDLYAKDPGRQCNIYVSHRRPGAEFVVSGQAVLPWSRTRLDKQGGMWLNAALAVGCKRTTITHEMGHILGLWHTHRGISEIPSAFVDEPCRWPCYEFVKAQDRSTRGDLCEDTPPTPANYTCAPPNDEDCAHIPFGDTQPKNFMGYGPSIGCRDNFTLQQIKRMHCWIGDRLTSWLK